MCVLIFSTAISHYKKNLARYRRKCRNVFHVKYQLFLSDFNETWILLDRVSEKAQIWSSVKMCLMGVDFSMRTDEHDEVSSRFSKFSERA